MNPSELLDELSRINAELDDEYADNTAGRLYALRYETLPQLLVSQRHLIATALHAYLKPSHSQLSLFTEITHNEREEHTTTLDGNNV